jgi:hypothetical protein
MPSWPILGQPYLLNLWYSAIIYLSICPSLSLYLPVRLMLWLSYNVWRKSVAEHWSEFESQLDHPSACEMNIFYIFLLKMSRAQIFVCAAVSAPCLIKDSPILSHFTCFSPSSVMAFVTRTDVARQCRGLTLKVGHFDYVVSKRREPNTHRHIPARTPHPHRCEQLNTRLIFHFSCSYDSVCRVQGRLDEGNAVFNVLHELKAKKLMAGTCRFKFLGTWLHTYHSLRLRTGLL